MLNTKLRRKIEWHFYNYKADLKLDAEKIRDIAEANLIPDMSYIGSHSKTSNPTEAKAQKLWELNERKTWAAVVENTYNAFRFEPEYAVMVQLYEDKIPLKELSQTMPGSTFWYWRNRWLNVALMWAREYHLLGGGNAKQ